VSEEVDVVSPSLLFIGVDLLAAIGLLLVQLACNIVNIFTGEIVQDLILHLTAVVADQYFVGGARHSPSALTHTVGDQIHLFLVVGCVDGVLLQPLRNVHENFFRWEKRVS